ncbi:MAG: XRE family transcriptional regulator [Bacteroidetes bacterium GWA2_30_7]|nr:MAG: XRE family transcriptional regulator [Bacteroidetes bacterium GWA2_30_7]
MYKSLEEIENAKQIISPPGDTLAETIDIKGISQPILAMRMGRPIKTINEIIKGKTAITPETAIQLERVLGIEANFWLEREKNYRLELAEIEDAVALLNTKDWIDNFPLAAMKNMQWVVYENTVISKANALYSFFGVSGQEPYFNYYHKNIYEAAYRMSTHNNKNPFAVSAWLKKGEHQAEKIKVGSYDISKFKNALLEIKNIMAKQPANFFSLLQSICASVGVRVVHTPCLPQTMLHGSTRWVNDTPLIQLSNLYKRNDIFWFTFFHEAGHIIKHGKRDIFVEGLKYSPDEQIKENEANDFAIKCTFTKEQEKVVLENIPLTQKSIIEFSNQFNTHPAMIIGRLARVNKELNAIGFKFNFFQTIDLGIS